MQKNNLDLKLFSVGLILLYTTSFLVYYQTITTLGYTGWILTEAFLVLIVASVGVFFLQEWARKIIVLLNVFLIGCIVVLLTPPHTNAIHPNYVFASILIVWLFSRPQMQTRFIPTTSSGTWKSILVIDDDETVTHMIRPLLVKNGYSVMTAATGEEGISVAQQRKPDLILLDVILPKLKGREVCRRLKADVHTKHIPVVFLTAKDSEDDIKAEMEAGAVTHLTKPVDTRLLLSTISNIFNKQ